MREISTPALRALAVARHRCMKPQPTCST